MIPCLIQSHLTDELQMSDCQCIIAAWSDSPMPIAVVQLVTTLLIAGLDKSLHIMSKESKSSNCQWLLDLVFKSIYAGQVQREKSSICVRFKLCSRTHRLQRIHENSHPTWKYRILEFGYKLHPTYSIFFLKIIKLMWSFLSEFLFLLFTADQWEPL